MAKSFGLTAKNSYDIGIRDSESNVIVTDSGIFQQSKSQDFYNLISLKHFSQSAKEPRVYCISNIMADTFFMCARNGIYYFYNNQYHYLSNQELGLNAQASKILLTKNFEILIGTVNGLHIKKFDIKNLHHALREKNDVSLVDNFINVLFEDKNNVIWVGTNISGAYQILPTARVFSHFSANSRMPERLVNNLVLSMVESPSGEMWVGDSRGGISVFDGEDNIRHLSIVDEQEKKIYHEILDIEFDRQQNAWVSNALGVTKFSPQGVQLETVYLDDPSLTQQTYATQLLKSADGRLWATGLESGLNLYRAEQKRFIPVRPINWPQHKPFAKLSSVAFVDDNILWFGGYQGILYRYDLFTREASQFVTADTTQSNLAVTQIYGIAKDKQNRLWISGMGGIGTFDLNTQEFTYLGNHESFSAKTHYSVILDNQGYIWSTPTDKLLRIDPKDFHILTFERGMGMPIIEFSPAAIKDRSDKLWLGGLNGLIRYDPLKIVYPHKGGKPQLTRLELRKNLKGTPKQNTWVSFKLNQSNRYKLSPGNNSLRFSFSLLDFSQTSSMRYRYRLLGHENKWSLTKAAVPEAVYTQIPYGDYRLQVAASADGIHWSQPQVVSSITILPYFWQNLWFKGGVGVFILLLTYLFTKVNIRRIKTKALQLEQLVECRTDEISRLLEQRTRFFTFISHELKTPLTLVQDPLHRLQKKLYGHSNESRILLSTASRNVIRLSLLVERLLRCSTEQLIAENDSVSFNNLVKGCTSQLAEFALSSRVALIVQRNEECHLNCNPSDAEIIVYNLLNNAIKYNRTNGKVFVRSYSCNDHIVFSVADQGYGFASSKISKLNSYSLVGGGYGLSLAYQSVALLNGKIKIKSRVGVGSIVCALIPLDKNETDNQRLITSSLQPTDSKKMSEQTTPDIESNDNPTILMIVEDNRELREYLCSIFSSHYHCIGVEDAENAMAIAIDTIPNIIISDLMLPGMSGIELCQQLKSNQQTCHIPILLLTARADQETKIDGLKHQATDYLTKPFNSEELKLRIANLLELTQKLYQSNQVVCLNNLYIDDSNTPTGLGEKDRGFMRRFVETLELNYADSQYQLDQLCADLYMSKKQLSRKLKAISGKSPMEYLKEYRLEQAVKFLVNGDALNQVAIESGFSSQSYFSTCFKNHYGVTPKHFQTSKINQARESQNHHARL